MAAIHGMSRRRFIAIDVEFSGSSDFVFKNSAMNKNKRYCYLRDSVNIMMPIQIGIALASNDGELYGAWNFNLEFDREKDNSTAESLKFLENAGFRLDCHKTNGIPQDVFGQH